MYISCLFFLSLPLRDTKRLEQVSIQSNPLGTLPETIFNGLDDLAGVSLQFSEFRRFPRNLIRGKQKLLHFWSYYLANNADLDSSNPLVIPEVG